MPTASRTVQVAFGAEYRRDALSSETDTAFATGDGAGQGGPTIGISGDADVAEVFGEIQVAIPGAFWGDILAFVSIGAAFVFFLLRAIGQHSLYPNRDPRILESANLSN
jgi:hypothetical protein